MAEYDQDLGPLALGRCGVGVAQLLDPYERVPHVAEAFPEVGAKLVAKRGEEEGGAQSEEGAVVGTEGLVADTVETVLERGW